VVGYFWDPLFVSEYRAMYTSSAGVRDASSALDDRRDGWNDCKERPNSLSVDVSLLPELK
jgi:hypothetical protein